MDRGRLTRGECPFNCFLPGGRVRKRLEVEKRLLMS